MKWPSHLGFQLLLSQYYLTIQNLGKKKPDPIEHINGDPTASEAGNYTLPTFKSYNYDHNLCFGYDDCEYEFLTKTYGGIEKIDGISWCQDPALFEPIMSVLAYGNEASLQIYYQSAIFLITVPKFTSQRGYNIMAPDSDSLPAKVVKTTSSSN